MLNIPIADPFISLGLIHKLSKICIIRRRSKRWDLHKVVTYLPLIPAFFCQVFSVFNICIFKIWLRRPCQWLLRHCRPFLCQKLTQLFSDEKEPKRISFNGKGSLYFDHWLKSFPSFNGIAYLNFENFQTRPLHTTKLNLPALPWIYLDL